MKLVLSAALLASCIASSLAATPAQPSPAAGRAIDSASWLAHVTTLSSDQFEGRAPGTPGEKRTTDYLQQQFRQLGLAPGNPDGSYLQAVSLAAISSYPTLSYTVRGKPTQLKFGDDYVAWSARAQKEVDLHGSELVFVGYGVQAPELHRDDYQGMDLKGKTLVMLAGEPPPPATGHPGAHPYGRWAYKFALAARLGAAGALIIHDPKTAGAAYDVVRNTWTNENFFLDGQEANPDFPLVPGWLQHERARDLLKAAGFDLEQLTRQAGKREFHPVPLGATLNFTEVNAWRTVATHNVVARIEGSDPQLKHEVVLYSAHWDHFGIDETLPGPRTQQIFHGARDNAAGVAALLEIAKAYQALPVAPKRTIVFLATTAEERGQLGARHYVHQPLYPLQQTLVNLNLHGVNVWGRTRSVELRGMGKSSVDDVVAAVARRQGRTLRPESPLDAGNFYRGDQYEFARAGVPVVVLGNSLDYIGHPPAWGRNQLLSYQARVYHTVHDVVDPKWDLRGAVQDMNLLFETGYQIAQGKAGPVWREQVEFRR
ncbi:peptidase M28 [Duganella sp. Leaf126]|uniref:M20/M25/M40 family metallo-hydrolase n=1 Tax=Duganella sp. Leaf126 TaxID=1736266 RepID=UPI0006F97E7F|nr:M20/M25/M40 family metallo-hydrolase [Duganella sp. Leaf126]KQQ31092.1 peptidase M28 [Duganella sp. Leaf126]